MTIFYKVALALSLVVLSISVGKWSRYRRRREPRPAQFAADILSNGGTTSMFAALLLEKGWLFVALMVTGVACVLLSMFMSTRARKRADSVPAS